MNRIMLAFLLPLITLAAADTAAQTIRLDSTFNATGMAIFDAMSPGISNGSVLQPDGKLLLCATSAGGPTLDILVVRYLQDGSLDAGFGTGGNVRADYRGHNERGYAIALQPDGRILIAGSETRMPGSVYDFALLRLLPDGRPDSTFGNGGWVITNLGTNNEYARALAVQPDGMIVAAGRVAVQTHSDFAMVRYLPDGSLDTGFGNAGIVKTTFMNSPLTKDEAYTIALLPDGRILLGGFALIRQFGLARYHPDGSLDTSFGEGGMVITDIDGDWYAEVIFALTLLPDGRFLAGGQVSWLEQLPEGYAAIIRYMPDGEIDHTFGHDGISSIKLGTRATLTGMALIPDGRLLVGGFSDAVVENRDDWLLVRLLVDGKLDPAFGMNGYVTQPMGGVGSVPYAIRLQPDSRIVMTGLAGLYPRFDLAAIRFAMDMTLPSAIIPVTCYGGSDGSIRVDPEGGVPPYMYSLDGVNFQDHPLFAGLAAGAYGVTVRDANGLTGITGFLEVGSPPRPAIRDHDFGPGS